ncbi:hypothetical protein HPP92_022057 [Vanilla planifolia]|uniref:Uncharacterized protein n=1 Tax=Vanilla planifolia TaxID=51239 RepID=A0A835PQS1_VANPL|nr:hypothetical protein HPP92_022057 [Vanilla planifolia]
MMCEMLEYMDAYYLRRILSRLVDKEMNFMLRSLENVSTVKDRSLKDNTCLESNDQRIYTSENMSQMESDKLDPQALDVLYKLISLVHTNLSIPSHSEISGLSSTASIISTESGDESNSIGHSSLIENPVASILWNIDPLVLQDVLLFMVNNFPRTLEGLILHMLSPTTAEVLTRKFDEIDCRNTSEEQSEFYRQFYSVFDDQYAAMGAILLAKESFSFQAFCNVLEKYLGVSVDKPAHFVKRTL